MIDQITTTRESILQLYGARLLRDKVALLLESDILGDESKCLSMIWPSLIGPNILAHQFEEDYCERIFPTPVYRILGVMSIKKASDILTRAKKDRDEAKRAKTEQAVKETLTENKGSQDV
jgi:hypothetical protein